MELEKRKGLPQGESTLISLLKFIGVFIADAFALIIVYTLAATGNLPFAVSIVIAVVVLNIVIFNNRLYPIRWMLPGIFFVIILVIYPIFYTFYTGFTNFGDGHLEAKEEVIQDLLNDPQYRFAPPDALTYRWRLFNRPENPDDLALWLTRTNDDGTVSVVFAPLNGEIIDVETDDPAAPESYNGYVPVPLAQLAGYLGVVQNMVFGVGDDTAQVRTNNEAARPLVSRFVYDAAADTLLDQQTNILYVANDEVGFFFPKGGGAPLNPGYTVVVGFFNFTRFFTDPRLQGPLVTIFTWTVMFAFLSVFTTFVVGLFLAIILNDARLPGKKIIRSLLIIPYALPGVISIMIWRGMLNQELGVVTNFLEGLFGTNIPWFNDSALGGAWTRLAIIIVNLWLGYPYMMLICSGALQAIPSDIYEAAAVDGASPFERFWNITLPLLLVAVGPLLIASFVYNFNNYLLIEALNAGGPPIPNSPTPAGYTDILISYVYRLAFGNSTGADYGYASAISVIIFLIVASITIFQFRITRTWEEVGENA